MEWRSSHRTSKKREDTSARWSSPGNTDYIAKTTADAAFPGGVT